VDLQDFIPSTTQSKAHIQARRREMIEKRQRVRAVLAGAISRCVFSLSCVPIRVSEPSTSIAASPRPMERPVTVRFIDRTNELSRHASSTINRSIFAGAPGSHDPTEMPRLHVNVMLKHGVHGNEVVRAIHFDAMAGEEHHGNVGACDLSRKTTQCLPQIG
jgi:hypothetical protein